ncbi:sensor histidine kinase [Alkalitalea saponilacus]|uniref:histidine kinase n=1 Tax=Alkalitalea saponilacus TaxID=889453 RepID=A0A1T5HHC8_9BACT|nr:HAMP domain-containing sensor histidine kinase [Alkalitalea saponilacus]ASB48142.1 hypothetical protein CDL62_02780 [Alkalitalea saponilacus]SKC20108.1 Signal transduction histidine kinase [Alkalitalea saponilacus]
MLLFYVVSNFPGIFIRQSSGAGSQYLIQNVIGFQSNMWFGFPSIAIIALFVLISALIFLMVIFRQKNHKLMARNKKLEQENAAKDRFFSIVAHDLKSPFNSLIGLSEMLMLHSESMNQEQVKNYSKMVHQSTSKLYSLVDNLLQWSRTQLGKTDYRPEKIDVSIVSSNIVNLLRISAQEKDIVISLNMDQDLIGIADVNIFSAVIRNLVSNAVKFSKIGGTIYVNGKMRPDKMIEVEVVDRGVGMDEMQIEKAFRIDSGSSTTGTFNEKGTGLGLILCKEFVEINKGSILLESKPGKGTSVKFTLPSIGYNMN